MEEKEAGMEESMQIIMYAGDAQNSSLTAMDCIAEGRYEEAGDWINKSLDSIKHAHNMHIDLLQKFSAGENVQPDLLLVHALDHLTMATTLSSLAQKLLKICSRQ